MARLKALEAQGDQAIAGASTFIAEFLAARSEAQLSPIFGHEAVASLAAANASFADGMNHIAVAHQHMRELPSKLGLQPTGWGEVEDSPSGYAVEQPRLQAV